MKRPPWATVEVDGVRVHFERDDGTIASYLLSVENAGELVAAITAKLTELRSNPELQKKIAGAGVNAVIDWWTGRKR